MSAICLSSMLPLSEDLVDMTEEFDEALETPRRSVSRPGSHLKASSPEYIPGTRWNVEKGGLDSPATASTAAPSLQSYDGMPYSEYGKEYGSTAYSSDEHLGYDAANVYGDGSVVDPSWQQPNCVIDPSHLDPSFSPYDLTPSIPPMDFATDGQYSETPWGAYDDGLSVASNAALFGAGYYRYAWQASMLEASDPPWVLEGSVTTVADGADAVNLAALLGLAAPPEMPKVPPGQHMETTGACQAAHHTSADFPLAAVLKLSDLVVGARAETSNSAGESPIYDRFELLQFRAFGTYSRATALGFRACKLPAS
jgi:hypothetical protein